MSNYIQLNLKHPEKEILEIFIALLGEQGFEGFEEGHQQLAAYIPEENWNEEAVKELAHTYQATYTSQSIAQRNWNEEWEKNFEPVVVGNFCAVRAHFHAPIKDVAYEIIITPKMSFGTGHHATTFMMMDYMQQLNLVGKTVLDFGTGTGILAILAAMKGAAEVVAIDNDDWSVENAVENIAVNRQRQEAPPVNNIILEKADSLEKFTVFNVILANINKHVLLANMGAIKQHLTQDGVIVMSGLLAGDREDIETAANNNGLKIVGQKQQNAWIALQLTAK